MRSAFLALCLGGAVAAAQSVAGKQAASATQPVPLSVSDADSLVKSAEHDALTRFHVTERYKQAKTEADASAEKLKQARLHGTAQEKLGASHDFVVANEKLKDMEATVVAADPDVIEATKLLGVAEAKKSADEGRINQAMQWHTVVKGMTKEQVADSLSFPRKNANPKFHDSSEATNSEGRHYWRAGHTTETDSEGFDAEYWKIFYDNPAVSGVPLTIREVDVFYGKDGTVDHFNERKQAGVREPGTEQDR
jgi:hypothetical protein